MNVASDKSKALRIQGREIALQNVRGKSLRVIKGVNNLRLSRVERDRQRFTVCL